MKYSTQERKTTIYRIFEIQERAIASKRTAGWKQNKIISSDMPSLTILRYTKLLLIIFISRRHQYCDHLFGFFLKKNLQVI